MALLLAPVEPHHLHLLLELRCPRVLAGRARVAVVAGRVAGAFAGTRGGAGGVGGASTATGAGIAAGGRLADQGADGAICWRSIDGWLLPSAGGRLGCSTDGWLLGCPIAAVAPGAARKFRSLTNATARVQSLNQCVAPASRPATLAHGQRAARDFWARPAPATHSGPKPLSEASEACKEELRLNEHGSGRAF